LKKDNDQKGPLLAASAEEALAPYLFDGMSIAVGGFGLVGTPEYLLNAIHASGVKNLTVVSNNAGTIGKALGLVLEAGQISHVVASYPGNHPEFVRKFFAGELTCDFTPQGTMAEKMRAGGAGIPAFYTPTGFGTAVAEGKETRHIGGRDCILEQSITVDLSLVRGEFADDAGNIMFRKTARNFNPDVASCGRICVVEVREVVPAGSFDPDHIHMPGIYVDHVLEVPDMVKHVEIPTFRNAS
jgi:3-oxoacid CoA-transferase, A subunit|tara:strand:- start:333 stop:1058 length:726 start_codon:yes stop_codon:yes gene_type:complete